MLSLYLNKPKTPTKEDYQYVRGKGADIRFAQTHPDFLLRHANFSLSLVDTEVNGAAESAAPQAAQSIIVDAIANMNSTMPSRF